MTPSLNLKTVTEISKRATAIIREMEKTGSKVVIVRYGKAVALLRKFNRSDKGEEINVSRFRNGALAVIAEIGKSGNPCIITRDGRPVAFLQRITDKIEF